MFGIGIIGCGKIAQVRHIPEYNDNPDAKLVAFYDLNTARAKALAEQYGGRAYESVEALLADPNVDAVSVCSANASHAEITVAALEAGKHVGPRPPDCFAYLLSTSTGFVKDSL